MLLLTRNCWVCLKFFPQTDDYNQRWYETNCCKTEPHETLSEWPIRFGNISHSVKCGIVEKFLRLIEKTCAKQTKWCYSRLDIVELNWNRFLIARANETIFSWIIIFHILYSFGPQSEEECLNRTTKIRILSIQKKTGSTVMKSQSGLNQIILEKCLALLSNITFNETYKQINNKLK